MKKYAITYNVTDDSGVTWNKTTKIVEAHTQADAKKQLLKDSWFMCGNDIIDTREVKQ